MSSLPRAVLFLTLLLPTSTAWSQAPGLPPPPNGAGDPFVTEAEKALAHADRSLLDGYSPGDGEARGCRAACAPCCPRFYLTAEALFLRLDRPRDQVAAIHRDSETLALVTHDVGFGVGAGPRLGLGYYLNECSAVEVSYFGLLTWDGATEILGNGDLQLPGGIEASAADFRDDNRVQLFYGAKLNNAEINYFRRLGCSNFSLLAGFRFLRFDESLDIRGTNALSQTSDYAICTKNNLFGAQLGGRWRKEFGRLGIDAVGKAGLFGNGAQQHTFLGDADNTIVVRDATGRGSQTAFVGELGITGTVRLCQRLQGRLGYNLLWIDGIARAPSQLDFSDSPDAGTGLASGQGAFLHGANVGLEYCW